MCPHWFERRAASYPNFYIAVRGSAAYFAVRRETHGMAAFGTTRAFRNVRYLIAIGGAKRTLTNDV